MYLLKVEELKEGMILQRDIIGDNGRYIIPSGTILTSKHIRVLKIWGIGEAYIVREEKFNDQKKLLESFKDKKRSDIEKKDEKICEETVRKKFMFNDMEHPLISELYQFCLSLVCKEK